MKISQDDLDSAMRAMRAVSGSVDDDRPLVAFLYLLGRDHLTLGAIEDLILKGCLYDDVSHYTNGWLAEWAKYTADRLTT